MALTQLAPAAVNAAIQVREVTTLLEFDAMRSEWNALVTRLDLPSPFQSWDWNRAWWNHFGAGRSLLILSLIHI